MLRMQLRTKLLCAVLASLSLALLAHPAAATPMSVKPTGPAVLIGTGAIIDGVDGNYFHFTVEYQNDSAWFASIDRIEIVMLSLVDLDLPFPFIGDTDLDDGNLSAAVGTAEAEFEDYRFSGVFHPTLELPEVEWILAELTIDGSDHTLTPTTLDEPTPSVLITEIVLDPHETFTVEYKVHSDIFGDVVGIDIDIGELMLGIHFIPEPSTALLLAGGLLGLSVHRRIE